MIIARIFDRAKRVWLTDDVVRISDLRREIEVGREEVAEVSRTPFFLPTRIRVRLVRATVFGDTVYFFPPPGQAGRAMDQLRPSSSSH